MGNPTENFSTSQRACLIKPGEKYSRQVLPDLESKPETLHALFNSSRSESIKVYHSTSEDKKIERGGKSRTKKEEIGSDSRKLKRINGFRQESIAAVIPYLPEHLVKLDLQCYPESLENLQKLHIRGGHLSALGRTHDGNDKWNVKIPRLNFLKKLRMDWRVLHDAFPHLIYLEKFKCPKMTFFPCDGTGVWFDREKLANQPLEELESKWSFLSKSST
ncbi:hypothetical protein OIU76_026102 [Salix suchowensis]|nr:hypothetical protein OIU76_026102 [Salix suchowensis]